MAGQRSSRGPACREAREELVALHRDELSPLRAESIRSHLASCPACREDSFELDLAMRAFSKMPEIAPPRGLVDRAMRHLAEAHGWVEDESGVSWPAGSPAPQDVRAEGEGAGAGWGPPPRPSNILLRPVRQSIAWAAVAATVAVATAAGLFEPLNEAFGRAQRTLLGRRASQALDRAADRFLEKLRL
jgi:anti-sigma factor RsiW